MLDFLILYEHKEREFENACLIKAELENRGYVVEISHAYTNSLVYYRIFRRPKVVIVFALYNDQQYAALVTGVSGRQKKVLNLQYEQVLAETGAEFHVPRGLAAAAPHVCWGTDSYERLLNNGVKRPIVLGAIQMDFLSEKLRPYYMSRGVIEQRYGLPAGKKMILYISSYVYTTLKAYQNNVLYEMLGDVFYERLENAITSKKMTLEILRRYLSEHPDEYVVYRPHPGERTDEQLNELLDEFSNFYVISTESVKQWILIADDIITWNSTAIAEVYYAEKNCVVLRPIPLSERCNAVIFKNARSVSTYDELLGELTNQERVFPIPEEDITRCYGEHEEGNVYLRIGDVLEKIHNTDEYDVSGVPIRPYLFWASKWIIKGLITTFHITERTWPFSKSKYCRDKLTYIINEKNKYTVERVTDDEIIETTEKIKKIINGAGGHT